MDKHGSSITLNSLSSGGCSTLKSTLSLLHTERIVQHPISIDTIASLESQQVDRAPWRRRVAFWDLLRLTVFTTYRQLFALICIANLIGIVVLLTCHANDSNAQLRDMATASVANLTISILVRHQDPDAVIIDTKKDGQRRPDLISLAETVYRESGAEAVFFISNRKLTKKVVEGLEKRRVPIFAPIFDS